MRMSVALVHITVMVMPFAQMSTAHLDVIVHLATAVPLMDALVIVRNTHTCTHTRTHTYKHTFN